jgi:hypothetical protein
LDSSEVDRGSDLAFGDLTAAIEAVNVLDQRLFFFNFLHFLFNFLFNYLVHRLHRVLAKFGVLLVLKEMAQSLLVLHHYVKHCAQLLFFGCHLGDLGLLLRYHLLVLFNVVVLTQYILNFFLG